ncbi:MAG TPA: biotin/lipoyl-containing protein, partial [Ignavibacteriaceae bacterium]
IINENELNLDGEKFKYELIKVGNYSYLLKLNNEFFELTSENINGDNFKVVISGNNFYISVRTALQEKVFKLLENSTVTHNHHTDVKAPMPGLILKIRKNIGDKLEQGESVVILEAMKMENDLKAPASGLIEKIFVTEGSAVEKGTILLSIK